jgi:hypothetical protein
MNTVIDQLLKIVFSVVALFLFAAYLVNNDAHVMIIAMLSMIYVEILRRK